MRTRLRDKVNSLSTRCDLLTSQLRNAESLLQKILKRRRFTYRQRRELKALLAWLHVKTLGEQLNYLCIKTVIPRIAQEVMRPSPLFQRLRGSR